jgi:Putative MetA-pathway of phenol degradation
MGSMFYMGHALLILALVPAVGHSQAIDDQSEGLRALCPDRPAKGTSPCTLDPGHFQIEIGAVDMTRQRDAGITMRQTSISSTTAKFGMNRNADIEFSMNPWLRSSQTGQRPTEGLGDTLLRVKVNIANQDGDGKWAIAVAPFIKIPTARHGLGNGKVEVGVVVPITRALPGNMSLAFSPEIDVNENADQSGRHLNLIDVMGLNWPLSETITGTIEAWTDTDIDPQVTTTRASIDLAMAWIPKTYRQIQWDAGMNFGMNRQTPDAEVYFGISRRF